MPHNCSRAGQGLGQLSDHKPTRRTPYRSSRFRYRQALESSGSPLGFGYSTAPFCLHASRQAKRQHDMKMALQILGLLLAADAIFLSYFYVLRADYYFPDRYEDAFAATVYGLLFGLPVFGAFVATLVLYLMRRRGSK